MASMRSATLHNPKVRLQAVTAVVFLCLLAGCATEPPAPQTAATAVNDPVQTQTGSNLPRRNKPSSVIVLDKDAIQDAARGATRNPGK